MQNELSVTVEGVVPVLFHNARLVDPLDPITIRIAELTGKRKKMTDADRLDVARLEWEGGLYLNDKSQVIVPGPNLEAMLRDGAKDRNKGKEFTANVCVLEDPVLEYDGPKDLDKMWESKRFMHRVPVVVNRNRVMRTRPCFPQWRLSFTVLYSGTNEMDMLLALQHASARRGIGDGRPRFGRFRVISPDIETRLEELRGRGVAA